MNRGVALSLAVLLSVSLARAAELSVNDSTEKGASLPFDPGVINRHSLDHLPRSLSIRQGPDVWLGYDLERAKVYKVWQAPAGKPGLIAKDFVTKSAGTMWFEDTTSETWRLQREGRSVPLTVRYLGCSQRGDHFELSWELRHASGTLKLQERVRWTAAPAAQRVVREIRVADLAAGDVLLPPVVAGKKWKWAADGSGAALTDTEWHRVTLP